jgi:hypothetical protein
MNDYELGTNLRRQLLADQQRGIRHDPRRLQALVGDFCGDQQLALLPALKHLVLTPAFSQALAQSPALPADPHLALQLQQELEAVFAPAISSRTATALRGLLALPATPLPTATPTPPRSAAPPQAPAPAPPMAAPAPTPAPAAPSARSSGSRGVLALLSFMAGVLVVGVVGALAWLMQLNRPGQPMAPQLISEQPQAQAPREPAPPQQELTPPPAPNLEQAELERAIRSVQQLYSALSSGDIDAARRLFGGAAADQFDPSFFSQFSRVSVADLVETGRSGSAVELVGLVTFTYPDGSSQVESRSFSVDTATDPALITASSFQSVVQPR